MQNLTFRQAARSDLNSVTALEQCCFPEAEAADRAVFQMRLEHFPECFWLAESGGRLISMINGMTANASNLTDAMYENDTLYSADGQWLMLFGVATDPAYRKQGAASRLMNCVIEQMKKENRRGIVLTCKEHLLPFYQKFGFVSEGVSASVHGGAVWYQMRLDFQAELRRCAETGSECSFYLNGRRYLLYGWRQCDGDYLNVSDGSGMTVWQTGGSGKTACAAFLRAYHACSFH